MLNRPPLRVATAVFLLTGVCTLCGAILFAHGFDASETLAADSAVLAVLEDSRINESSGLAASRTHPGCLWVHNDSGDQPRLFLVRRDGRTCGTVMLRGADAIDWEDMCSFELNEQPWLLVADVGDNTGQRGISRQPCCLYLMPEPRDLADGEERTANIAVRITLEWPNGPINCESVAVDVQRKEILLLEKSGPFQCRLFRLPLDLQQAQQTLVATQIAVAAIPFATAIDISPDGRSMAVVSMWGGMILRKNADESWETAFQRQPTPVIVPKRRQGETVCFDVRGETLLLNSEGAGQPLWEVSLSE